MAGPTASILLPEPLSRTALETVEVLLQDRGWEGEGCTPSPASVALGFAMDWQYRARGEDGCEIDYNEPESLEAFENQLGWSPQGEVLLIAGPNLADCHLELAQAAVALVHAVGGVINLGGDLAVNAALPGQRWRIPYGFEDHRVCEYWVVDANWLESWLEQANFRMVK